MEITKDLYNILELDKNCTLDDIKRSYRKLALKYHPDKCDDINSNDKFIDIQSAYQILSNPFERKRYDALNNSQKIEIYDSLKIYIKKKIPKFDDYIKLFFDDEINLKNYVERMDLLAIYNHIMEKIPNIDFPEIISEPINNINICGRLSTTFEERYQDKYRKIQVNRRTKGPNIYCIPLRESKVILQGEGEYDRLNNIHGDIVIEIEVDDEKIVDFIQMNNDIYYIKYISLYEYLYGGEFELEYIDKSILNIVFTSFVEKFPLITLENKGMPLSSPVYIMDSNIILDKDISRGNFLVIIKIKHLDLLDKDIKKLCDI